jgi:hypothetical protein
MRLDELHTYIGSKKTPDGFGLLLIEKQENMLILFEAAINVSDMAKVEYKYNERGQQIAKLYDNNLIVDSVKYNIQGWITEKQATNIDNDNIFGMQLSYYNPTKPNTAPRYTGNITE